jgi:AcrR family transcriptional regulator
VPAQTQEPVGRRARKRAATEAVILDAAERLFAEHGYRGTTLSALADEADLAIGTLYGHFGSKQAIYVALAERAVAVNGEYIERALATEGSPLVVVRAIVEAYERFHLDNPLAFRLVGLVDLDDGSDADRARIAGALNSIVKRTTQALSAAMEAGALRKEDPVLTARVMWAAANGVLSLHARGGLSDKQLRQALALTRELLLQGLQP